MKQRISPNAATSGCSTSDTWIPSEPRVLLTIASWASLRVIVTLPPAPVTSAVDPVTLKVQPEAGTQSGGVSVDGSVLTVW